MKGRRSIYARIIGRPPCGCNPSWVDYLFTLKTESAIAVKRESIVDAMPDGGGHPCATVSQKKHGSPGLFQQLLGLLIVAFELTVVGVESKCLSEIFDCLFELASTSEHGAEIVECIRIGRINLYGSLEMLDGKVRLIRGML